MKTPKYFAFTILMISLMLLFIPYHYGIMYWKQYLGVRELSQLWNVILSATYALIGLVIIFMIYFMDEIYSRRKELGLMLLVFIAGFLFLEASSRSYLCNFASVEIQNTYMLYGQCGIQSLYEPHHYLNYHLTPNYVSQDGLNKHNSMSFRGDEVVMPKPENVFRIVVIGGSTTYTTEVKDYTKDFAHTFESHLESMTGKDYDVVNAGVGGYTSYESLINLEFNVLNIEPDLIIINHGINDILAREVLPENYKPDNSGSRKQWQSREIPFIFYSTFVRLVTRINPTGLGNYIDRNTYVEDNKEVLASNDLDYFERNIRNMIAIAESNDIKVILASWAYSDEKDDMVDDYIDEITESNNLIREIAYDLNVSYYDFESDMPKNSKYWADGRHLNELGAYMKGYSFAKYLKEAEE